MDANPKYSTYFIFYILVCEMLVFSFVKCLNNDLNELQLAFDQQKKSGFVPMRGRKNFDDYRKKPLKYELLNENGLLLSNVFSKNLDFATIKDSKRLLPLLTLLNNIGYKRAGFVPMRGRKNDPTFNTFSENEYYKNFKYLQPVTDPLSDLMLSTNSHEYLQQNNRDESDRKIFYSYNKRST